MVRKSKNILSVVFTFILLLAIFVSGITLIPARAENEVNYKKKIVSVVYDNSGSMDGDQKPELARYSLQMLVSMLGQEDELIVCPMSEWDSANPSFTFDLTKADRSDEIRSKIVNNNLLSPTLGTPQESIDAAINELAIRGMKKSFEAVSEQSNVEYWLIMLTDGAFDNESNVSVINNMIERRIKEYSGLNTIYMSFGTGGVDLTSPDLPLNQSYPFSAYFVPKAADVVSAMESVANKILGKYGADNKKYNVKGNTLTINLDKFDFAMNSISVIAQDCGAKLQSVSYNGKSLTAVQENVLVNCGLSFLEGYLAVIKDTEYISGGTMELVYDKPLNGVSVLVEPAIFIDAYIEYLSNGTWTKTNMQFINSNLVPGDQIRIQYQVLNASDRTVIDTKTIFGKHVEKVTYCGQGYGIGDSIALQEGNNEITVTVEVLNGQYSMYSSLMCYVEKNPTYYRIESVLNQGTGGDYKKANVVFTVFAEDKKLSKTQLLDKYDWEVVATGPDGSEVGVSKYVADDGSIIVDLDATSMSFGNYDITAKVINKENKVSRTTSQKIAIVPKSIEVNCLTKDVLQITPYLLRATSQKVEFELVLDDTYETFENGIIDYEVTLDNTDISDRCVIEDKKLVFNITTDSLVNLNVGKKQIQVKVSTLGGLSDQATYDFELLPSVYKVEKLDYGERTFDRYNISNAGAGTYFKVYKDDILIPDNEVLEALNNGEIKINANPGGWITLLPCAVDVQVTQIDGETVVACMVVSDIFKPLDNLLGSFIFVNQKDISLSYNGVSATDTVFMSNVSFMSRVIRWIILLIIILIILHITLFIVGFFIAKPLPKGTLLFFKNVKEEYLSEKVGKVSTTKLNMSLKPILLWHLSRLIPFREFKDQKPVEFSNIMFKVDKNTKRTVGMVTKKRAFVEYRFIPVMNKDGMALDSIITACKKGKKPTNNKLDFTNRAFLRFFMKTDKVTKKGENVPSVINTWYGVHALEDGKVGKLMGFIVFIRYQK